jgi:hypothetical protein
MSDRAFWEDIRRGLLAMVATLIKARPNDPYTIEIRVVERSRLTN